MLFIYAVLPIVASMAGCALASPINTHIMGRRQNNSIQLQAPDAVAPKNPEVAASLQRTEKPDIGDLLSVKDLKESSAKDGEQNINFRDEVNNRKRRGNGDDNHKDDHRDKGKDEDKKYHRGEGKDDYEHNHRGKGKDDHEHRDKGHRNKREGYVNADYNETDNTGDVGDVGDGDNDDGAGAKETATISAAPVDQATEVASSPRTNVFSLTTTKAALSAKVIVTQVPKKTIVNGVSGPTLNRFPLPISGPNLANKFPRPLPVDN